MLGAMNFGVQFVEKCPLILVIDFFLIHDFFRQMSSIRRILFGDLWTCKIRILI